MAAGHVGPLGVHLCEFDLSAREALLGRRQEPSYCLRPIGFDRMAVIVQAIAGKDAEIALRAGISSFGSFQSRVISTSTSRSA